ncbi:MAG TPA: universal stress protein [Mycobacteriales bacterium]|jgi:nucleotide-binding universal stress UspA family protein
MSGTESVLVVLDGSGQDVATLDWATDEAAALGTGLTVARLYAGPVTPDRAPAQLAAGSRAPELDLAAGRVAERAAWLPVTTCAVRGDPLPELLRLAHRSSRVVLGEGRTGRFYVSLAAQVAVQTSRPAVVVRGRPDAAGPVVAHLSGGGSDELVLRDAVEYARRRQAPLRALHAYRTAYVDPSGHVPPYFAGQDATGLVTTSVAPWARACPDVLVECVALPGSATALLLEVSAGAGLLVVGARDGAGLSAALRGSTASVLARRARCPVVITR